MLRRQLCALTTTLLAGTLASSAIASWIEGVTAFPTGTMTAEDRVALEIFIVTSESPAFLRQPTQVAVCEHEIVVEVFPDYDGLHALDSLVEIINVVKRIPKAFSCWHACQMDNIYASNLSSGTAVSAWPVAC